MFNLVRLLLVQILSYSVAGTALDVDVGRQACEEIANLSDILVKPELIHPAEVVWQLTDFVAEELRDLLLRMTVSESRDEVGQLYLKIVC